MQKLAAQVKEAEVRGCMAAFVDAGLVKVANQQGFENLCDAVTNCLPDNYDLQTVADATDYVLSGGTMQKTAAEKHDVACKAALGELLMMKTAGQIDNATFVREAGTLMKMAEGEAAPKASLLSKAKNKARAGWAATEGARNSIAEAYKAKDIRDAIAAIKYNRTPLGKLAPMAWGGKLAKGVGKTGLAYGIPLATAAGAAKLLYDKYAD